MATPRRSKRLGVYLLWFPKKSECVNPLFLIHSIPRLHTWNIHQTLTPKQVAGVTKWSFRDLKFGANRQFQRSERNPQINFTCPWIYRDLNITTLWEWGLWGLELDADVREMVSQELLNPWPSTGQFSIPYQTDKISSVSECQLWDVNRYEWLRKFRAQGLWHWPHSRVQGNHFWTIAPGFLYEISTKLNHSLCLFLNIHHKYVHKKEATHQRLGVPFPTHDFLHCNTTSCAKRRC